MHFFDELHEIAGWVGMVLILGAYAGISTQTLSLDTLTYQALNAAGALLLIYSTYTTRSYPVMVLNVVWLAIALLALARLVV